MLAHAVADPDVAAGQFLQHEGEVLGAHGGLDVVVDHVLADDAAQHLGAEGGFVGMVDGGRVVALELEFHFAVHRRAGVAGDLFHTAFDQIQHVQREGAHRAAQLGVVGHHMSALPA